MLNREINNALKSPEFVRHIANNGLAAGGGSPADFTAFLERDTAIWTKVIAAGGHQRPVAATKTRPGRYA